MSEKTKESFDIDKFEEEATKLLDRLLDIENESNSKDYKALVSLIIDNLKSSKGDELVLALFHDLINAKIRKMGKIIPEHLHRRMLESVIISVVKGGSDEKSDLTDADTSKRVGDVLT